VVKVPRHRTAVRKSPMSVSCTLDALSVVRAVQLCFKTHAPITPIFNITLKNSDTDNTVVSYLAGTANYTKNQTSYRPPELTSQDTTQK